MLLVLHQNVVIFIQDTLHQNFIFPYILNNVSKICLIFEPLLALPYDFAFIIFWPLKDTETVAFDVLVDKDVKPGQAQWLPLVHVVVYYILR